MEVKKKNNCGVFAKFMRLFLMQVESANNKNNQKVIDKIRNYLNQRIGEATISDEIREARYRSLR